MTKTASRSNSDRADYDPVFLHAHREALIVLAVWSLGLAWTVGYCLVTGYNVPAEQVKATLGVPNWIFCGVLVPWVLVIVFSIWFGLCYMAADDLGQADGQSDPRCNSAKLTTKAKESRDA